MATRPPSPCRHYGCRVLVSPPGYCLSHSKDKVGWYKTSTRSSSERGYGHEWTKLRKQILIRDDGLCQVCAKNNRVTIATEVDHITPKSQGGTDIEANLQSICSVCHKIKTHREANRSR